MRLARLRRLAWVLVLVLSAGLASPALATTLASPIPTVTVATHTHPDGTVHAHAPSDKAVQTDQAARAEKPPFHCPGCVSAAECAVSCLGVGVLSPPFLLQAAVAVPKAWTFAVLASPTGTGPLGDIDPPRPVFVR